MGLFGDIVKLLFTTEEDDYVNDPVTDDNSNGIYDNESVVIEEERLGGKPTKDDVKNYIDTTGARIALMKEQNDTFRKEYESVTCYLADIQIIDGIEGENRQKLISYAENIVRIEEENRKRAGHDRSISDFHYKIMQQYEESINHELATMRKKELYQADIKHDLKCLEQEKQKLYDEQEKYHDKSARIRTVSVGAGVLLVSLMILFGVICYVAAVDMTIPFILLIIAGGLLVLYIFTGMRDARYNLLLLDKKCNKCINLLNSVKIKYVNNTALLDYMCSKYDISNSVEFEKVWRKYIQIKEDEEAFETNKQELEELAKSMTELLDSYGLKDTSIWICQAKAILDNREMVEVRHGLNIRRQKLRKQIGFNDERVRKDAYILQKILKKRPQLRGIVGTVLKKYSIEQTIIQALRQ